VDETRLRAGDTAYAAGDWATAAREYLAAAASGTRGSGYAFHRAGNSLMKLKRLADAATVYQRALEDELYDQQAAVACNLGTAKAALGVFDEAADAFEASIADLDYDGRYKALQGLGGALYQMGRIEEAAEAYRRAALDDANVEPGKALNNLGMCFMALDRPEDAVEAYRAAVDLEGYAGRGRAAANLGLAYAALGMHDRAVVSFERARDELGHSFSSSVEAAYRASKAAARLPEKVEGWTTGEMPPVPSMAEPSVTAAAVPPEEDEEDGSRFFTITDAEMKVQDRAVRRKEREDKRSSRPLWVTLLTWGAVFVIVVGGIAAAYLFGLGYPTQQMTVNGMLEAFAAGESVASYWVAVPATDVEKAMSGLPPAWTAYEIGAVERSARTSKAEVTVTLEQGGVVNYEISMAREGVGWKVNGVASSFNSMDGGL
jgi:tetratricopeptide (TPR) repeat protein